MAKRKPAKKNDLAAALMARYREGLPVRLETPRVALSRLDPCVAEGFQMMQETAFGGNPSGREGSGCKGSRQRHFSARPIGDQPVEVRHRGFGVWRCIGRLCGRFSRRYTAASHEFRQGFVQAWLEPAKGRPA